MAQRMAGSPGIRERVMGFLGDNAYTRAWSKGVDSGVITPVELAMMKGLPDDKALEPIIKQMAGSDGQLTAQGQQLLDHVASSLDDGAGKGQRIRDAVAAKSGDPMALQLKQLVQALEGEELKKALSIAALRDGVVGYTGPGNTMRQFVLGSPAAAYGLPLAGAGMAAWGVHDVLAAQQQAEKEDQLPLQ